MMAKQRKKKRRQVKGEDWHGWVAKYPDGSLGGNLCETRRSAEWNYLGNSRARKIIRVKLVEVKP